MKNEYYELSNNLFGILPCNCYETSLDPRLIEERENEGNEEHGIIAYSVNTDIYEAKIAEIVKDVFDSVIFDCLKDYGVEGFANFKFRSPSQYNYVGDWIDIDVKMKEGWKKDVQNNAKIFFSDVNVIEFIKLNYSSGPGYVNLMPTDYDELIEGIEDDNYRAVAAYLTLALVHHGLIYRGYKSRWASNYDMEYIERNLDGIEDTALERYDIFELAKDPDFESLYYDDPKWEEFYRNLGDAIGYPWMKANIRLFNRGDKFDLFGLYEYEYTPALKLVHWAIANRYTLKDLERAVETGTLERLDN